MQFIKFIKIAFVILGAYLIFNNVELNSIRPFLSKVNYYYLAIAVFLFFLENFVQGVRLYIAFKEKTKETFWGIQKIYFTGVFGGVFSFGGIGGDIYKTIALGNTSKTEAFFRLMGLRIQMMFVSLAFLSISAFLCFYKNDGNIFQLISYGSLALCMSILSISYFSEKISKKEIDLDMQKQKKVEVFLKKITCTINFCLIESNKQQRFILPVLVNGMAILFYFMLVLACGLKLSWGVVFFLSAYLIVAYSLPFTVHGRGVVEMLCFLLPNDNIEHVWFFLGIDYGVFLLCSFLCSVFLFIPNTNSKDHMKAKERGYHHA